MSLALSEPAPSFRLTGVDGAEHDLERYSAADVLVLVQSCNHCPYVQAWEGRMKAIQGEYGARGVALVAVNSNDAERYPEDSFDEMRRRAERERFNFDYLWDEDQAVARALGAERTPEVYVFDQDRRLVYHGAIDDSRDEIAVTQHYLRDALEAVLAGGEPPVAETPPVGCTVKWRQSPQPVVCGSGRAGSAGARQNAYDDPRRPVVLEFGLAADAGDGAPAYPDGAVVIAGNVDPAGAPERGSLTCDIGRSGALTLEQPLCQRRVQAARDRIFGGGAILRKEGPHLERLRRALGVWPDDAEVEVDDVRLEVKDGVGTPEQNRHPSRSVVGPRRGEDVGTVDPQDRGNVLDERLLDVPTADQRRCGEREPSCGSPHRNEPGAALLYDQIALPWRAAG
jgi:peroxiredoxin